MTEGYVLAYRKCWTHPDFGNLLDAAIWNFLFQNAFWQDGQRVFNGAVFNLKRGQIVVSVSFLASGFMVSEKYIRGLLKRLSKGGMVDIQGANKGTIITICNYNKYQFTEETKGEQDENKGKTKGDNKKEEKKKRSNELLKPDGVSQDTWDDWLKIRKAKKAVMTESAINLVRSEAEKLGWSLQKALETSCGNSWAGFKAEWIENENFRANNGGHGNFGAGNPTRGQGATSESSKALAITEQIKRDRLAKAQSSAPERTERPAGPDLRFIEEVR